MAGRIKEGQRNRPKTKPTAAGRERFERVVRKGAKYGKKVVGAVKRPYRTLYGEVAKRTKLPSEAEITTRVGKRLGGMIGGAINRKRGLGKTKPTSKRKTPSR